MPVPTYSWNTDCSLPALCTVNTVQQELQDELAELEELELEEKLMAAPAVPTPAAPAAVAPSAAASVPSTVFNLPDVPTARVAPAAASASATATAAVEDDEEAAALRELEAGMMM